MLITILGIATSTLTNPIWLIKTRMQLQTKAPNVPLETSSLASNVRKATGRQASGMSTIASQPQYRNSFDCLVKVVQQEGIKGLFRGLGTSYLGVIEGTVHWISYEQLKKTAHRYRGFEEHQAQQASQLIDNLLLAGVAKFFAASAAYPHEVVRTRIRQVDLVQDPLSKQMIAKPRYNGMVHVMRTVFREEGIMAFYGGLSAHLLRTVPNAAIMFFCYESVIFMFAK
jgi:solute carrier family 25, member 33/36